MEEKGQEPGHKHSFIVISGELFVYMVLCKETRFKEKSKDNLLKRYVVLGCNLFDKSYLAEEIWDLESHC